MSHTLQNETFKLITSEIGGTLETLTIKGVDVSSENNGALFCCPMIFSRLPDNKIYFRGETFDVEFPPGKTSIHGLTLNLQWETIIANNNLIRYELPKSKLPQSFPFPHSSFIEYSIAGRDLCITTGIYNCVRDTPAIPTIHPMFRYKLKGYTEGPKLKANVSARFDFAKDSKYPLPYESPKDIRESPFRILTELPTNLDHTFIAENTCELIWPSEIGLKMTDETPKDISPINPLHIWTTTPDLAFAIEHGGPANLFWLADKGKAPLAWLPVCQPGKVIFRRVRYQGIY